MQTAVTVAMKVTVENSFKYIVIFSDAWIGRTGSEVPYNTNEW